MQIEVGTVLEGKVTGITNFGAFVSLPEGKTGMVHISEISSSYVKDIHEFLKEGDTVKVKVITVDEKGKVGLSIKKAIETQNQQTAKSSNAPSEYIPGASYSNYGKKRNAPISNGGDPFEDMMNKFKSESDEKMTDLKKVIDSKRSSAGFSRKNTNKY